jgi:hypothetical protein
MEPLRASRISAYLAASAADELIHGAEELFDGERLAQQRRRAEPIGFLKGRFVRGAHDDRRRGIPLLDASNPQTCGVACVRTHANEIGDNEIGSRVGRRTIQSVDERKVIALIAQHLADEVPYVAVVLDDQDVSYSRHGGGIGPGAQF